MSIHPSALISPETQIGRNVSIGPYTVIEGKVTIGDDSWIAHHVTIGCRQAEILIGERNKIFSGAIIGSPSQDAKEKGDVAKLIIGNDNILREFITLNLGSSQAEGVTKIGDHNLFMAYVHLAHDCVVGDHVVISNCGQLAGHVVVEDYVNISGACCFNQFISLGRHSYICGDSTVNKDVLPYSIAQGKYAIMRSANKIGLKRAGFSDKEIMVIHKAIRTILKGGLTLNEALEKLISEHPNSPHVKYLVQFARNSKRGLAKQLST